MSILGTMVERRRALDPGAVRFTATRCVAQRLRSLLFFLFSLPLFGSPSLFRSLSTLLFLSFARALSFFLPLYSLPPSVSNTHMATPVTSPLCLSTPPLLHEQAFNWALNACCCRAMRWPRQGATLLWRLFGTSKQLRRLVATEAEEEERDRWG